MTQVEVKQTEQQDIFQVGNVLVSDQTIVLVIQDSTVPDKDAFMACVLRLGGRMVGDYVTYRKSKDWKLFRGEIVLRQ